jgi:murein hydrolase activator
MKKILFLLIIFASFSGLVSAQDEKGEMERERQQIQKELADLQKTYDKVKGQRNVTLSQLNLIKRKVEIQERYLNNINREIRILNDNIYRGTLEINRLNRQLDTLKTEYARSVVYAYKNRTTYDFLNFIFSASNFNDAVKRVAYLKSYRAYREQQVNVIKQTQQLIAKRKVEQQGEVVKKREAQHNQSRQVAVLENQRKEKDNAVKDLKSREKEIRKEITTKQKRDAQLKSSIAAVVRREIEKAKEEAKKNAITTAPTTNPATNPTATNKPVTTTRSYLDLNAADVKLNASFSSNKGKLPWPVDNGVTSIKFGPYTVEGTKLRGDNPGITIATPSSGIPVKSVFDGEVAAVANLEDGMMVVIRHGKYFTTYSNLGSVSVSKGTQIKTGQVIGKAGRADDGNGGQIDFILMIEGNNVNPEPWLRR